MENNNFFRKQLILGKFAFENLVDQLFNLRGLSNGGLEGWNFLAKFTRGAQKSFDLIYLGLFLYNLSYLSSKASQKEPCADNKSIWKF